MVRIARTVAIAGSIGAIAIAVHTAVNLRHLRRPTPAVVDETVEVLIPARDEAGHVESTVRSALAQLGVPDLRVTVLDDGSTDGTGALLDAIGDYRLRVIHAPDESPPHGWLGKPWACARLGAQSNADVLVFVDADVDLARDAICSAVTTLRDADLAMVAPYPLQIADSWLERLLQPLVTWSWAATMPLRWAEQSTRPSLSAANGQFLVIDGQAYRAIGGHAAVRAAVIEDVALMRALKRAGLRTATVDGSHLASCRMYESTEQVINGYSKSLWAAFNGAGGSIAVNVMLTTCYVAPAIAMMTTRDRRVRVIAAAGYTAGVASRLMVAQRTRERALPDALAHPLSIAAFAWLNALSWRRQIRGENRWKGRPVVPHAAVASPPEVTS